MQEILKIEHLTKKIKKKTILEDISFTIYEQEIVGFVGPNGAGKSTTMKCIANIYYPSDGRILITGKDVVKEHKGAMQQLGIAIEQPALYPHLSGHEHFKLMADYKHATKDEIAQLEQFSGLGHQLNDKTRTYSMGMKQRMALSLALMKQPKLIILDEPTNGLDPQSVFELREEIKRIKAQGSSILISSHTLKEIEHIADRIIFIDHGHILQEVQTKDILHRDLIYVFKVDDEEQAEMILKEDANCQIMKKTTQHLTCSFKDEAAFANTLRELSKSILVFEVHQQEEDLESYYRELYGGIHD